MIDSGREPVPVVDLTVLLTIVPWFVSGVEYMLVVAIVVTLDCCLLILGSTVKLDVPAFCIPVRTNIVVVAVAISKMLTVGTLMFGRHIWFMRNKTIALVCHRAVVILLVLEVVCILARAIVAVDVLHLPVLALVVNRDLAVVCMPV